MQREAWVLILIGYELESNRTAAMQSTVLERAV
jgi:hypothetical protein